MLSDVKKSLNNIHMKILHVQEIIINNLYTIYLHRYIKHLHIYVNVLYVCTIYYLCILLLI